MKTIVIRHLLFAICFALFAVQFQPLRAQARGDELKKQAVEKLEKKEYITARYFYLQAYYAYSQQEQCEPAVECGIMAAALYHRDGYYKEASELLYAVDTVISAAEKRTGKSLPELRFSVLTERLRMSVKQKNAARGKEQLTRLQEQAKAAANDSIDRELLYLQADYYYTFGLNSKGDAALNSLISRYSEQKDYQKVDECYKSIITIARKANNTALMERTYDKYILWNDSIRDIKAQEELSVLKQRFDDSLSTINEKDRKLATRQYFIVALCALSAILAAVLVVGAIVLLRFIILTRKQRKAIAVANEHNELKSKFIYNISDQMEPTLNTLPQELPGVQALHTFSAHIQELSELESTLTEPFELEERNMATFCESVMDKIKGQTREDVTLTVNAPKLQAKVNPEHLEHVLLHLLTNAAEFTPEGGKIWLDFKKRGAHTHQFIISDTGPGIAEEARENLFKPFTEVKDLTQGDGLGLPICSLLATKMNGTLSLDTGYTRGARFVLELHV